MWPGWPTGTRVGVNVRIGPSNECNHPPSALYLATHWISVVLSLDTMVLPWHDGISHCLVFGHHTWAAQRQHFRHDMWAVLSFGSAHPRLNQWTKRLGADGTISLCSCYQYEELLSWHLAIICEAAIPDYEQQAGTWLYLGLEVSGCSRYAFCNVTGLLADLNGNHRCLNTMSLLWIFLQSESVASCKKYPILEFSYHRISSMDVFGD
jgi:hypothetical protein